MQKNINQQTENRGFFIQNVLAGPLVVCDPPHIKNGLYLEPLQPGEVKNLSYYDRDTLARSMALDNALRNGYAISLNENEYDEQIELAERRQFDQMQDMERKVVEAQAAGNVFEAEQINLATAGNPHGDYSAEALMAQKNTINDPKVWANEYRRAKEQGLVNDPIEFKELVESGRIGMGNRGRRQSVTEMQNFGAQDQINMTSTKATIAMPGSYQVHNEDGDKEEMGGVYTQRRNMTNFNATGSMVGAETMGVIDSPTPAYSTHPGMQRKAQEYQTNEKFVEDIDLDQDEDDYNQQLVVQNNQIAERLAPRSPYIGQTTKRPVRR